MGELLAFSQSALLLLPTSPLRSSRKHPLLTSCSRSSLSVTTPVAHLSKKHSVFPTSRCGQNQCSWRTVAGLVSDSKVPTTFTVDSAGEGIDILPDSGGSDDSIGGAGGNGGGGGGNDGNNGGGGNEDESHEKRRGMSMSQKLTLGYAALVGIGGAMGYLKGGSQKSLIAGGVSASVLLFVYTMLPSNPFLASSVGLLLSASLLGVMGLRFKKSGKIFPTGVVTFVSLVMTGGYMHGILRGLH
ncbi:protein FATTY ACID EXPORT 2, chloroplastic-like isoform X1 [Salvia hispanica]|uniref:protein FATTY ACID EXPORT 2, chloroplastic-like isoform X1 n=1 Tax=Salvia hispanica TaxID=49212 RepID=UPI0020095014|nr:protein FATTY ACID EXPORT 2, chloroplastic-like isoform X1 [Salvia hispanica]XP_047981592.1 protein FATTY ACID EXPORT 2, chloroplastic-like isoform X1 [Salvia hispanica]XP_047981593.1 protein FATTY ACID EXPORT 2, chloroplastic-like isoform X1 [Salvia hispanica]